jgi:hypothetical protein
MATLNELGRNSSSVTYGPYATGQDLFPTLQAVDTWFRNDTWQGTATASGTTLTGTGTIWSTQARSGDYIIVAGQQRIVNVVSSDTSMTVTVAFSPAISLASLVRVVSSVQPTQTAGYISMIVRGDTNGVVSTTAGSATITGVGTYFLAELTNSVALTSMTGTVAIATDGTITGTSTVFQTGAPINNSLYPGDSITVTVNGAIFYFEIASVSSDTAAVVTNPPSIAISGATISKATNGVIGRSIQINGRMRTITAISTNTSLTVNYAMDFTDSNMKLKAYPRGTISNASAANGTLYGTTSATSSASTTLAIAGTITGQIMPGMLIYGALGTIPANTVITNQQFASGAAVTSTASTGTIGQNTLTVTSATNIAVGQLVQGNGAALAGIPAGTYVVSISGTSVVISQNLTGTWANTTVYFYTPGAAGTYTTSNATTLGGVQIYFSTVQATGANFFWGLGINNLISTTYTPFMYQTSQLDQVWVGDEVRTLNFSTYSGALTTTNTLYGYTTDYVGFSGTAVGAIRQTAYLQPFRREDSYINGNNYGTTTAFLSDLRVGDDLIIDGTEVTVTQLISNTQFKVDKDFTHTTAINTGAGATATTTSASGGAVAANTFVVSSATSIAIGQLVTGVGLLQGTYVTNLSGTTVTVSNAFVVAATGTYRFYNGVNLYKKLKLHGYTLEGTREGGPGIPTVSTAVTSFVTVASATGSGTNLTMNAAPAAVNTGNALILPGMQVLPSTTGASSTLVTGLTYITNQQYSTATPTINNTSVAGVVGTNTFTTSGTQTGTITIGMIVTGNNAAITGVPPSTYVLNITGTTPNFTITLSNNLTTGYVTGTVYFIAAGGQGVYTTSSATTLSATAITMYPPQIGKFTQAATIFATAGTSYPIGTQSIVVTAAPTVGQYNFVKIVGGGGPAVPISGQVTYVSTFVNGANTAFTTQLHIGAEIAIAGQYLTVVNIISDTQLIVSQNAGAFPVQFLTPIYRTVPLYTYAISTSTTTINLATPIKTHLYTNQANPPMVYFPSTGADFLEYVYSSPNYSAEQGTVTLRNQSFDRKYVGFRIWPLFQSTNAVPTATATISTAFGAYATPVYERWTASYGQTHGVGINQADLSGGTMVWGYQTTTTLNVTTPVAGSANLQMGWQGQSTGYPQTMTGTVNMGQANATYTGLSVSQTVASNAAPAPFVASLYGVFDITAMTQISGGTLFLFGNNRYFAIQGRSSANIQTQWTGCLEFERAQPEDASTGLGTTSGIVFGGTQYGGLQLAQGASPPTTSGVPGFNQSVQFTIGTAPWPCFAYFNGNRMPTGAQQIPTVPQLGTTAYPIHGCVLACPRVRNSAGDLVGFNAHIYSALTVTTGRWGHQIEFGNYGGSYNPAYLGTSPTATSNTLTNIANMLPQIHMGQIIPVYTNVYNAKRFMFSPVVVLGPSYDPDVRGRIFGLKVLPSALGTLMDTVSITVDGSYFYNTSFTASDHWVLTTPPSNAITAAYPGQQIVVTTRFTNTQNTPQIQQSWRSLEDVGTQASSTAATFTNNFRFALPA